jgi:hypothetical protein
MWGVVTDVQLESSNPGACAPETSARMNRQPSLRWIHTRGSAAHQWQNTACVCQLFAFQSAGSGAWTVKNVKSNLNLDLQDSSSAAGAAIVQNTASSAAAQTRTRTHAAGGYYKLAM